MNKEDAKAKLASAASLMKQKEFEQAYILLDPVEKAFPTSARVVQYRASCLISMGRLDQATLALEGLQALPGDPEAYDVLRQRLTRARQGAIAASSGLTPPPTKPSPALTPTPDHADAAAQLAGRLRPQASTSPRPKAENQFMVEMVSPVSVEETSVAGRVVSGAFYTGATVTVMTPDGLPLLAPIIRISRQETPLNVIREGMPLSTMVLRIEVQHVAIGSILTSDASGETQAATMVAGPAVNMSDSTAFSAGHPKIKKARELAAAGSWESVKILAEGVLRDDGDNHGALALMSRYYMEGGTHVENKKKALEYASRAFEAGGHGVPEIISVLADALGLNGQPEHGLRYLERLYETSTDMAAKEMLGGKIEAYHRHFRVPNFYQFINAFGEMVFESSDPARIRKALESGGIPKDAKCRKNRVGRLQSIEDSIALEHETVGELYGLGRKKGGLGAMLGGLFGGARAASRET